MNVAMTIKPMQKMMPICTTEFCLPNHSCALSKYFIMVISLNDDLRSCSTAAQLTVGIKCKLEVWFSALFCAVRCGKHDLYQTFSDSLFALFWRDGRKINPSYSSTKFLRGAV